MCISLEPIEPECTKPFAQEIIEMNNALKLALDKGATMKMVAEDWEFLQVRG